MDYSFTDEPRETGMNWIFFPMFLPALLMSLLSSLQLHESLVIHTRPRLIHKKCSHIGTKQSVRKVWRFTVVI